MGNESGEWVIHGLDWNDPNCLRTPEQLVEYVNKIGFLPLFKNDIPGFSAEEHTPSGYWWSGDEEKDPWEWREILARSKKVAYGKFFDKKAGFISLEWLPVFSNYRREGYDFDSLFDEGRASMQNRKLMRLFEEEPVRLSPAMKQLAGFGKGGDKNFDGKLTELQMQTYLVVCDFRRRRNKKDQEYGWPVAAYCMPEYLWGYEMVTSKYNEEPKNSGEKIRERILELYPDSEKAKIYQKI